MIKTRRNNGLKKIENFCNSKYELMEEVNKSNYAGTYVSNKLTHTFVFPMTSEYTYIFFRCVK